MPVIPSKHKHRPIMRKLSELKQPLSLKDFYKKRNRVLIVRGVGGLGDILMHRMMFEDFKKQASDIEIHFACPKQYHGAVSDHPYIDKVLDVEEYNRDDYLITYMTTTACGRYEMKKAPYSGKHRSDIWANYCGLELTNHDMHISLTDKEKREARILIEKHRDRYGPSVLIAPISAMELKNLLDFQLLGIIEELHERGLFIFGLHTQPIYPMIKNDIPVISKTTVRQWLAIVDQSDYVISVDTAAFHAAGGLGKPHVGIFTFADGKVYNKYFDKSFLVQKHRDNGNWDCGPCYNWGACTKTKKRPKPCLTEITVEDIMVETDKMLKKWPVSNSI